MGDAIPARSRRDRVADTPPPTAPVIPAASALPPTLAPWKGRPCPEKVGSQAHRPTSAILPAAVKRPSDLVPAALQSMSPNRTDAPLCLQLSDGRYRRAGQRLRSAPAGDRPHPRGHHRRLHPRDPGPGGRSGRSPPPRHLHPDPPPLLAAGRTPRLSRASHVGPGSWARIQRRRANRFARPMSPANDAELRLVTFTATSDSARLSVSSNLGRGSTAHVAGPSPRSTCGDSSPGLAGQRPPGQPASTSVTGAGGRRRHRQAGWRSSRSAPAPWSPAHGA